MDLDGDLEVVAAAMEKSGAAIYSGKVADIGNDGNPDIVGNRNFNAPPLEVWENLIRQGRRAPAGA